MTANRRACHPAGLATWIAPAQFPEPDKLDLLIARLTAIVREVRHLYTKGPADTIGCTCVRRFRPAQQAKVVSYDAVPALLFWRGERSDLEAVAGTVAVERLLGGPTSGMLLYRSRRRHCVCGTNPSRGSGTWRVSMTEGYVKLHGRSAFPSSKEPPCRGDGSTGSQSGNACSGNPRSRWSL